MPRYDLDSPFWPGARVHLVNSDGDVREVIHVRPDPTTRIATAWEMSGDRTFIQDLSAHSLRCFRAARAALTTTENHKLMVDRCSGTYHLILHFVAISFAQTHYQPAWDLAPTDILHTLWSEISIVGDEVITLAKRRPCRTAHEAAVWLAMDVADAFYARPTWGLSPSWKGGVSGLHQLHRQLHRGTMIAIEGLLCEERERMLAATTGSAHATTAPSRADDLLPGKWFTTNVNISDERLRKAVERGKLTRSEKKDGRWKHSLAEVRSAWPEDFINFDTESVTKRDETGRNGKSASTPLGRRVAG